jgi:upstream activation factor subunit UAF30
MSNVRKFPFLEFFPVVGKDPLPRTELTKRLWEYIRKHELPDPKDKRSIRADEKLLAVFGGKKVVSMFEMTKYNCSEIR